MLGSSSKFLVAPNGNIGIGVVPGATEKLRVAGNVVVDGNIGAKYQDVAEWVETDVPLEAGTVVIVDPARPNRVVPSQRAYDTRVAGAVSAQPGLILGEQGEGKSTVAQSGRVRVKVDATYGAIKIGDLLVTSPGPGTRCGRDRSKSAGKHSIAPARCSARRSNHCEQVKAKFRSADAAVAIGGNVCLSSAGTAARCCLWRCSLSRYLKRRRPRREPLPTATPTRARSRTPGQIDVWSFTAAQGDYIVLAIGEIVANPDPGFVPWMQLKNHDTGTVVTTVAGALAAQIAVNAPLTATYDVLVHDSNISRPGTALGSYTLTLVKVPGSLVVHAGDQGGAMTNGANHAGSIYIGDLDAWTFSARKGTTSHSQSARCCKAKSIRSSCLGSG